MITHEQAVEIFEAAGMVDVLPSIDEFRRALNLAAAMALENTSGDKQIWELANEYRQAGEKK